MVGFAICNYKIRHPSRLPNSQGDVLMGLMLMATRHVLRGPAFSSLKPLKDPRKLL